METFLNLKPFISSPLCSFYNLEDETPIQPFRSFNQTKSLSSKSQELMDSEIFFHKILRRVPSLVFQIIEKILKLLTICILYFYIICLNLTINEK